MADTWFKCEPTQFLLGLQRIATPEQALVYTVVCFRIYEANGPVPNDASAFVPATHLGVRKVRNAIDALIEAGKLYLENGELMNARAASELGARASLSAVRSKAGKASGEARKPGRANAELPLDERSTTVPRNANERSTSVPRETNEAFAARSADVQPVEPAENSHSSRTHVPYAGAREDKIREESPLPPSKTNAERLREEWDLPDLDQPLQPAERVAAVERIASISDRSDGEGQDVDIPALVSWVMLEAKMVTPPFDMPLVAGWVRMGADVDRIIKPTVARLAANAKGGVKSMRYFDQTIRDQFDAEKRQGDDNIAYFDRIARRHAR